MCYSKCEYCRLCLTEDKWKSALPIFDGSPSKESLSDVINKITGISIRENDGLPDVVCHKCLGLITVIMNFIDDIKKNDAFLRGISMCMSRGEKKLNDVANGNLDSDGSRNRIRRKPGPKSKSRVRQEVDHHTKAVKQSTNELDSSERTDVVDASIESVNPVDEVANSSIETKSTLVELESTQILVDGGSIESGKSKSSESPLEVDKTKVLEDNETKILEDKSVIGLQVPNKSKLLDRKSRGRPPMHLNFCEFCNRPFGRNSDKNNHIASHKSLNVKLFICTYCNMCYHEDSELQIHKTTFHPFVSPDIFKQKELQVKSILNAKTLKTDSLKTITPSDANLDLIEEAGSEPSSKKKKRRHSSSDTSAVTNKKSKQSDCPNIVRTVVDVHAPMQGEQTNDDAAMQEVTPDPVTNSIQISSDDEETKIIEDNTVSELEVNKTHLEPQSDVEKLEDKVEPQSEGHRPTEPEVPKDVPKSKSVVPSIKIVLSQLEKKDLTVKRDDEKMKKFGCNVCLFVGSSMKELFMHKKKDHRGTGSGET